MLLYQDSLLKFIDNSSLDSLPRTLLVQGPKGCGKHLLASYLKNKFNFLLQDITNCVCLDLVNEIYSRVEPYLYILNVDEISIKDQNVLLKILEEPFKNTYFFLMTEDVQFVIDTIKNRSFLLTFKPYQKIDLNTFINQKDHSDIILSIADTPGQISLLESYDLKKLFDLCISIFDKIEKASWANTLSILDKIASKDEKDKYEVNLFWKVLHRVAYIRVLNNLPLSASLYDLTEEYFNKLHFRQVDKRNITEQFLITLKREVRKHAH